MDGKDISKCLSVIKIPLIHGYMCVDSLESLSRLGGFTDDGCVRGERSGEERNGERSGD